MELERFDALTFDCFGTLVDWETGILAALRSALPPSTPRTAVDAELLALFARHEAAAESGAHGYITYREVLREVMKGIAGDLGVWIPASAGDALVDSIEQWPLFEDTGEALSRLSRRYGLGILSNIDDDLFAPVRSRLGVEFRWVVTAQQVGSYKPSGRNFRALIDRVDVPSKRLLHAAHSRYHDILPAADMGLATVWIERRSGRPGAGATPEAEVAADLVVPDLSSLADLAGL